MIPNSRKIVTALIMIFLILGIAQAQKKVGTTAAPFLGISIGPRAMAMGSAHVALVNDVTAAYWNPGALAVMQGGEVSLSHTNWILGSNFNWVGINFKLNSGLAIAVNMTQLDYGREEITTIWAQEGTGRFWDAQDMAAGISLSTALTNRFSLGGTLKYINQRIWNESATAMAVDLGLLFRTNFDNMLLGISISNYGSDMRLDGNDLLKRIDIDPEHNGNNETLVAKMKTEPYPLPIFFRIGVAYDFFQSSEYNRLTFAMDALHPTDNAESVNVGAEYSWNEMVALRAGYKSIFMEDPQESWTLGAGLQYQIPGIGKIKIDYAYSPFEYFPDIQTFAVSYVF